MEKYSRLLLQLSAIFAIVGGGLGAHMAGSNDYSFQSVHAHILVVGWLTLFAWAVFYKVFRPVPSMIAIVQVWTGIVGTFGLTIGMWFYFVQPFDLNKTFTLLFFIIGGTVLLISFILFFILTLMKPQTDRK